MKLQLDITQRYQLDAVRAVIENPASWRLAEKLGFELIDTMVLLERA